MQVYEESVEGGELRDEFRLGRDWGLEFGHGYEGL